MLMSAAVTAALTRWNVPFFINGRSSVNRIEIKEK
jgi:hypothetical protein